MGKNKKSFYPQNLDIGDIILVSSKKPIKIAQRIKKGKTDENKYTHVIIVINLGMFIEATKNKKVRVFCYDELKKRLNKNYRDWKVIRKKDLTNEDKQKIFKNSLYFLDQKYNYNFLSVNKREEASYCSELFYKIYKKSKIKTKCKALKKNINIFWPVDVAKLDLLCPKEWQDITNIVSTYNKNKYEIFNETIITNLCKNNIIHYINFIQKLNQVSYESITNTHNYLKKINKNLTYNNSYKTKTKPINFIEFITYFENELNILSNSYFSFQKTNPIKDSWYKFKIYQKKHNHIFVNTLSVYISFIKTLRFILNIIIYAIKTNNKTNIKGLNLLKENILDNLLEIKQFDAKVAKSKLQLLRNKYNIPNKTFCLIEQYKIFLELELIINNLSFIKENYEKLLRLLE